MKSYGLYKYIIVFTISQLKIHYAYDLPSETKRNHLSECWCWKQTHFFFIYVYIAHIHISSNFRSVFYKSNSKKTVSSINGGGKIGHLYTEE